MPEEETNDLLAQLQRAYLEQSQEREETVEIELWDITAGDELIDAD